MRVLRRILFYVFLAAYLVVTPQVILYALGYLYRPGDERGLVRSCLIALDTSPAGARIHVGESRYARRTPAVIRDLLPGAYPIRLSLRDHQTWTGLVAVAAGRAAVLDRIILLPRDLSPRVLADGPFDELDPAPGPDRFVLRRGDRADALQVYDIADQELRPLLPSPAPHAASRVLQRHGVEGSEHTLLVLRAEDDERYLWCSLRGEREPQDVTRLFAQRPSVVSWGRRADDEVFALVDERLDRLDLDALAVYPGILTNVVRFAVHRGLLYALGRDNRFIRADRHGLDRERAGTAPAEVNTFWLSRAGYAIRILDENLALFLSGDGELFASRAPYHLADRGVAGLDDDPHNEALLVWAGRRLGRLLYGGDEVEERRPLRIAWFYDSKAPIHHAAWTHEGSHVLFACDGRLFLLALGAGGGPPPRALARCRPRTAFVFHEPTGSVYFLDERSRLVALRLLPESWTHAFNREPGP